MGISMMGTWEMGIWWMEIWEMGIRRKEIGDAC